MFMSGYRCRGSGVYNRSRLSVAAFIECDLFPSPRWMDDFRSLVPFSGSTLVLHRGCGDRGEEWGVVVTGVGVGRCGDGVVMVMDCILSPIVKKLPRGDLVI